MIQDGYSLIEMEIVNWGNFHKHQKFNLRRIGEGEGLFASPQASAILGVNGSGKTTLIDALMIALLPFEASVKLGVTNDYESGAGGGRSIKDYVLGKYSSSHDGDQGDLASVYGRESGCSVLLLRFQHNRYPDRFLSLGRLWWFSKYRVSDTQMGFLSFDDLSVEQLCTDSKLPSSPKVFKNTA
ncbi:AAA family ATPase, partial [bacterium]|nr:AAA family ATPase [bacterium]